MEWWCLSLVSQIFGRIVPALRSPMGIGPYPSPMELGTLTGFMGLIARFHGFELSLCRANGGGVERLRGGGWLVSQSRVNYLRVEEENVPKLRANCEEEGEWEGEWRGVEPEEEEG